MFLKHLKEHSLGVAKLNPVNSFSICSQTIRSVTLFSKDLQPLQNKIKQIKKKKPHPEQQKTKNLSYQNIHPVLSLNMK